MKGSPRRSAELSWPICGGDLRIQNGHTLRLPVRRLLTLSLVTGKSTGASKVGAQEKEGGRGHKKGAWVALLPSPPLISVSDKVEQRVHSGLHNKSIRE